ncbi:MAG: VOC family protein [Acidobacteriota bacterium]|nr:VOC family protein [Acidobacteriota bacterium]MDH3528746.1 VOC family protein [Acidobacteriota bacterium]
MSNAVSWFEIYVSDMDRAAAFYTAVLGKDLMDLPSPGEGQMKAFPMEEGGPGTSGALVKDPMGQPGPGGTMVYFQSDDVAAEAGRVESAGGKLTMPKTSIGEYGFIAMFEDTEGNHVGLYSKA